MTNDLLGTVKERLRLLRKDRAEDHFDGEDADRVIATIEALLDRCTTAEASYQEARLTIAGLGAALEHFRVALDNANCGMCENGHDKHEDCTSDCACVGQGKSRMERLERDLDAARAAIDKVTMAASLYHQEIQILKAELASARDEAEAERIENARLREAFVVMERAANQHEAEAGRLRERWEKAIEYARSLPTDGKVTGWTVLDALAALEGR